MLIYRILVLSVLLCVVRFDIISSSFNVTDNDDYNNITSSLQLPVESLSPGEGCGVALREGLAILIGTLMAATILEVIAAAISMRGSILDDKPRSAMKYLLYARLG